jgi:hypothetical protein
MEKTMRYVVTILLAAMLVTPAAAQDHVFEPGVLERSRSMIALFAPSGYKLTFEEIRGWTSSDGQYDAYYDLVAGKRYHFVGYCSSDCEEMNMILFKGGTILEQSLDRRERAPNVIFVAPESGRYNIWLRMMKCNAPTCDFTLQVFSD